MPFTESNYENAVLQLFTKSLGYSHVYGPDIERDYHSPLYEDELLPALQTVNPTMPREALEDAVYKLKNFESGSLLQKNMAFTDYLQNGVPVKYLVKGEERSDWCIWWTTSIRKTTNSRPSTSGRSLKTVKSGLTLSCLSTVCRWWSWS